MFGLNSVVFRPHNVYGENQNIGDRYRNVIGIFMNQIMQGKPMTLFGDGSQQRAFSYVGDIAPLIAGSPWIQAAHNEVINIGADVPCTVNELAQEVAGAMGVPTHPIEHLPARNEVQFAYSDHSKAKRLFGAMLETSLRDGLSRMASWARAAGVRRGKAFEGVEVSRNMPLSWQRMMTRGDETP
jgi:UDP-glucose 4-epimerase